MDHKSVERRREHELAALENPRSESDWPTNPQIPRRASAPKMFGHYLGMSHIEEED